MSALSFRNVWVEYGDQVVLERINLEIASGTFLSVVGPSGRRQEHLPAPDPRPGAADAGRVLLDGEPLPGRARTRSRHRVPALLGVSASDRARQRAARLTSSRERRLTARLLGARAARGDREERRADRGGRARRASRQISERAVRRHAAAPGDRAGARASARACCCSTSRSARSIPARGRRCTR